MYSVPLLLIPRVDTSWIESVPCWITLPVRDHVIIVFASHDLNTRGLSSMVTMALSVYLSYVMPSEYGVAKSPFFPITGKK